MKTIPILKVPNQKLSVLLDGQSCEIELITKSNGLYLSLAVAGVPVVSSARCVGNTKIIRFPQTTFKGNLSIWCKDDLNIHHSGFGDRYFLIYTGA